MTFAEAFHRSLETGCVIRLDGDPWLWRAGPGHRLISVDRVGVKDSVTTFAALGEWNIVEVPDLEKRLAALDEERKNGKACWLAGLKHAASILANMSPGYRAYKKDEESEANHLTDWHMGRAQGMADAQSAINEVIERETMRKPLPPFQLAK